MRLDATAPVTATPAHLVSGDLALAVAGRASTRTAGVALPRRGRSASSLAGADGAGVVVLQAWDADGEEVVSEDGWRSSPATATRIRLPDDAVHGLLVRLGRTSAVVSVEVATAGCRCCRSTSS